MDKDNIQDKILNRELTVEDYKKRDILEFLKLLRIKGYYY